MRRRIGAVLLICGALLLLASGGAALLHARQDEQAGRTARQAVTALQQLTESAAETEKTDGAQPSASPEPFAPQETPAPQETAEPTAVEIDGESYIGVLRIPALGLELPVMEEWSYARLKIAPCRQFGSAEGGNLVIAAHNYKSHFGRLKELQEGDGITFTGLSGTEYTYRVEWVENVQPQDVAAVTESGAALTLYTCTPGGKTRVAVYCSAAEGESME